MIFSRANLVCADIASKDPKQVAMNCVHVAEDGTTIGLDGHIMLVVEPMDRSLVKIPPAGEEQLVDGGRVNIPLSVLGKAFRNMPKGKVASEFVALTRNDAKVQLTTFNMREEEHVVGPAERRSFIDWKYVVRNALTRKRKARVCLNRTKLMELLKAIDSACPDRGGEKIVFIDVADETSEVMIRSINYGTGQHVLGVIKPINTRGQWLNPNRWERSLRGSKGKAKKRRRT